MKNVLFLLCLSMFLFSCGTKYDKAISDHEQTILGTKIDLGLKVQEVTELKKITVADSLRYYKKKAKEMMDKAKEDYTDLKANYAKDTAYYNNSGLSYKNEMLVAVQRSFDSRQEDIKDYFQYAKDYYKHWSDKYAGKDSDEVLRVIVSCRYSILNPLLNKRQELTKAFLMSPDGSICYNRVKTEGED